MGLAVIVGVGENVKMKSAKPMLAVIVQQEIASSLSASGFYSRSLLKSESGGLTFFKRRINWGPFHTVERESVSWLTSTTNEKSAATGHHVHW